jgi:hypothetical protein
MVALNPSFARVSGALLPASTAWRQGWIKIASAMHIALVARAAAFQPNESINAGIIAPAIAPPIGTPVCFSEKKRHADLAVRVRRGSRNWTA